MLKQSPFQNSHPHQHKQQIQKHKSKGISNQIHHTGNPIQIFLEMNPNTFEIKIQSKPSICRQHQIFNSQAKSKSLNPQIKQRKNRRRKTSTNVVVESGMGCWGLGVAKLGARRRKRVRLNRSNGEIEEGFCNEE